MDFQAILISIKALSNIKKIKITFDPCTFAKKTFVNLNYLYIIDI